MSSTKSADQIPEEITTLAGAYVVNIATASQAWYATSGAAVLAFLSFTSGGEIKYFDVSIGLPWAPVFVLVLNVLLNVSFCSAYMKQSTTARLFRDAVDEATYEADENGKRFLTDEGNHRRAVYFTLMPNFLNTVYPLARHLRTRKSDGIAEQWVYLIFKVPTDLILAGIPLAGCVLGLVTFSVRMPLLPLWLSLLVPLLGWVMFAISAGATLRVALDMLDWVPSSVTRIRTAIDATATKNIS